MKNYRITVNGTSYDVSVEELSGGAAPVALPLAVGHAALLQLQHQQQAAQEASKFHHLCQERSLQSRQMLAIQ